MGKLRDPSCPSCPSWINHHRKISSTLSANLVVIRAVRDESISVLSVDERKLNNKEEPMSQLILKDEVYAVVAAAIEVHRELASGFLEGVYQEAMEIELSDRAIQFETQKPLVIRYKNRTLKKQYLADFICFSQIIVELKALDKLSGKEESQMLNYLKATGLRVGLLINFGSVGRLEWRRFVK
jgi:GxxExxY protein